jgi:3-deoxy-D-manno-octulosonic-acid transferase
VLLVYFGYRWLRGKSREGWAERMGYLPVFSGEHPIWVHAVSAGEAVAAEAVVRALRERLPDVPILYTAGTPEGRATARKRMGSLLTHVAYAPYDLPWAVARAMDRVRPRLYLLVESDLWPNLLQAAAVRGVPAMLANGYISERTLRRGRLGACALPLDFRQSVLDLRADGGGASARAGAARRSGARVRRRQCEVRSGDRATHQ